MGFDMESFLARIKVKDLMISPVISIRDTDDLSKAMGIFLTKRIFYLPVVDENDKFVGLLTQKYIYKTKSPRKILESDRSVNLDTIIDGDSVYDKEQLDGYIVKKVMYRTPATMKPEDTVADALKLMSKKKIGCIPIIKDYGRIAGIITHQEVVDLVAQLLERSDARSH